MGRRFLSKLKGPDLVIRTALQRLRLIGFFEGTSAILLFAVAMPLKYLAGQDLAVKIVGSLHGGLFVLFVLSVLEVSIRHNWWGWKWILSTATASIVPGGTFVLDVWLKKQERLLEGTNPQVEAIR